jgi:hypothetical protein
MRSKSRLIASALFVTIAMVTRSAAAQCVGDCDGGASVTVNEVINLVNIALGAQTESACPNGIPSGAEVTVALIIQAVNNALSGCAPAQPDFQLHVAASVSAPRDSRGQLRVRIERKPGFSEPVEIDAMNVPDGVSAHAVIVSRDEAQLPLHIGAGVPIGPLDLTVVGRHGGAAATAQVRIEVQEAQPRAQQLIQAALDAGQIDLGTSLLYRAYATFGDARLPREFVGSGPLEEDAQLFLDIELARPTLSASILDELQPFLLRPDDPHSWLNVGQPTASGLPAPPMPADLRAAARDNRARCSGTREWITERSAMHPVRAWALCLGTHGGDEEAENNLFKIIYVVDRAYGQMVALMGPAKADEYGDDAIDVYAVPPGADPLRQYGDYAVEAVRGVAPPQPPYRGSTSSGYVMLPTYHLEEINYQLTVIHELFHVLQFAHTYHLNLYWFTEASASWASVHFNRTAPIQPERNAILHYENFGSFQFSDEGLRRYDGYHQYSAYIWPFFMEQEGGASRIADVWRRFENATSDDQATEQLDGVLGFKDNFHLFAIRNVNESLVPGDPVKPRYHALDRFFPEDYRSTPNYDSVRLFSNVPVTRRVDMAALASRYFGFQVANNDPVQSVEFDFSGLSGLDHLNRDALIHTTDGWVAKPVSLDDDPRPRFCFDLGPSTETVRGSFDELRLVLSNNAFDLASVVTGPIHVRPSKAGCAGWMGEIRWSVQGGVPGVQTSDVSTVANVTFVVDENPPTGSTPGVVFYKIRGGHLSYRADATFPTCHQLATSEVEMVPDSTSGEGATIASLATFSTNGVPQYGSNAGATFGTITVTGNCTPDGTEQTESHPNSLIPWWNLAGTYDLKEMGTLMQEDISIPGGGSRNAWTLRKVTN